MKKFDKTLYLKEMYQDDYFPNFLVDKIKAVLVEVVEFLESGERDMDNLQEKFDRAVSAINALEDEFHDNGSEIETAARDSIAVTVDCILKHFDIVSSDEYSFDNNSTGLGDRFLCNRNW